MEYYYERAEYWKKVIGGFAWLLAERIGAKGVSFVVSIILARLLLPEAYGLIALVTAIINILEVFVDGGMGVALVQKKDADDLDFSTVFFFNILPGLVLCLGMFIAAPFISDFYGYPELKLDLMLHIKLKTNLSLNYSSFS